MRYFIFLIIMYPLSFLAQSNCDEIFTVVEQMPELSMPEDELEKLLNQAIDWESHALEIKSVYVNLLVDCDGNSTNVKILYPSTGLIQLEKELESVLSNQVKWIPGKQRGKPVKVSYNLGLDITDTGVQMQRVERIKGKRKR